MKKNNLRSVIFAGLLVAVGIVLTNIVSISYPPGSTIIRIGIGFIPLMIISITLGPKIGFIAAIIQDSLGWILFGYQFGPYFIGFTLNAILYGILPYFIYNIKTSSKNIFRYLNMVFMFILLIFGTWALFNVDLIINIVESKLNDDLTYSLPVLHFIIYLIIFLGLAGVIAGIIFISLKKNKNNSNQKILFSIIILQIIVSLVLTPIWISILYSGATYLPQIPLRVAKTPLEVFVYFILLVRLIDIYKKHYPKKINDM